MNLFASYLKNFLKFKGLLIQLVSRDIKVKYKRSILGLFWSLLSPLLLMIVLSLVFSELFKFDIENYAAYLICGQILFTFFSEATSLAMTSIVTSGQLVKKVYIPKYIFPLSKVMYSFVNLGFSLIALVLVFIFSDIHMKINALFGIFSLIYLFIFCLGLGLILSSLSVFFRDIMHLYSVLITAWMYITPIFYPIDIIPQKYILIIYSNPLFYFITYFRETVLYGNLPNLELNSICLSISFTAFIIGLFIFYKQQDKFVLHI
ncbi:MAG: ABC transporter permease [Bacillota bacterium]|nr:ABC transporter permease [Bacillota bacterium]